MSFQFQLRADDYSGSSVYNQSETASNVVLAGDFIVARYTRSFEALPETGAAIFNPDLLILPPRWKYISHEVRRKGGLSGTAYALVDVYLVLNVLAADVGAEKWRFDYVVKPPRYEHIHVLGFLYRGEHGVAGTDVHRQDRPSVEHILAAGRTPTTGGTGWLQFLDSYAYRTDEGVGYSGYDVTGSGSLFFSTYIGERSPRNEVLTAFRHRSVAVGTPSPTYSSRWEHNLGTLPLYPGQTVSGPNFDTVNWATPSVSTTLTLSSLYLPMPAQWRTEGSPWLDVQNKGLRLDWRHVEGTAGPQASYTLKWRSAGSTKYWNASSSTWSSSPVTNGRLAEWVTIPAGKMLNGNQHIFQVATAGTTGSLSEYSPELVVLGVDSPTAALSIPGYNVGQVADMTPSVTVFGTPGVEGAKIIGWRAELRDYGGVVLRSGSGTTATPLTWDSDYTAANGEPLSFHVWVTQTGGEESVAASQSFVVTVNPPGQPTITVVPCRWADEDSAPGAHIEVSFEVTPYVWLGPTRILVTRYAEGVQRLIADKEWHSETGFVLEDYAAPTGQLCRYVVQAIGTDADGGRMFSPIAVSEDFRQSTEAGWVIDPTDPGTAVRCTIAREGPRKYGARTTARPLGRLDSLVTSSGWTLGRGDLTLRVGVEHQREELMSLLSQEMRLLVRYCPEQGTDGSMSYRDLWLMWSGEIDVSRLAPGPYSSREVSFPFEEQYPYGVVFSAGDSAGGLDDWTPIIEGGSE